MARFKLSEEEEKSKLTPEEEIKKIFDRRLQNIRKILQYHEDGLELVEISWKVRVAESYIKDVIRDGYEKMKTKLLEQYKLNGVEIMTERDEHGRFIKKVEEVPKTEMESEVVTSVNIAEEVTSEKKTITDHIQEIAKEIGPFKPADMVKAFGERGLLSKKSAIVTYVSALNLDAPDSIKKYYPSIYRHASLKKDSDGKYIIA